MERLEQYRQAIQTLLFSYASPVSTPSHETHPDDSGIETQVICDRDRDHYQLVSLGWQGHRRFYSCLMHLDIKDGKIWIQRNQSDRLIAQELVALGVPPEDIILGLQPEYARPDTDYGVA
jgi:XisI protein